MKTGGIYIHVPFCTEKCTYCDYYSLANHENVIDLFIKNLCKEIELTSKNTNIDWIIDTLFIGGGTPSLLSSSQFEKVIVQINNYFNQDISPLIERVFLKLMGHAMPIPKVNYLFDDQNRYRSEPGLVYAGVDNSRLPLLFEAMDSGIQAVKLLDQI